MSKTKYLTAAAVLLAATAAFAASPKHDTLAAIWRSIRSWRICANAERLLCRNMVAAVDVEINDFGLDAIIGNTQELNGRVVKVGIQGGSHDDMVDIAIYNHFGTRHIPPRPFMADCAEQNAAQISEAQRRVVYRVMDGADADAMLHQLGNWYRDVQRAHIRNGNWTPNAPATIKRKGSDRPLIDTGQLVDSVGYEVD